MIFKALATVASVWILSAGATVVGVTPPQSNAAPVRLKPDTADAATIERYCVSCHNARAKVGGLTLDPASITQPGTDPATWERVLRKLTARTMPPQGMPR